MTEPVPAETPEAAVKRPPVRFAETQALIQRLEVRLGHPVLSYWTSTQGSVCSNDVQVLYELLHDQPPASEVSLFIKSGGGDIQTALRFVNLLRGQYQRINVLLPLECASAATMIAMGADRLYMGALGYLTAIDSSLTHDLSPLDRDNDRVSVSQDELVRIVRLWQSSAKEHHNNPYEELFKYIHPLVVGAIDRASSLSIKVCKEILSYHIADEERAEKISRHLNSDYPSHSYPITLREAQRIGLNALPLDGDINAMLLELHAYYSEMAQRAVTDFDECNQHDNQILNIQECAAKQVFFQNDKHWRYIKEERRWRALHDESTWLINRQQENGEMMTARMFFR